MAVKRRRAARAEERATAGEWLERSCARGGLTAAALRVARAGVVVARADRGLRRLAARRPLGPRDLFDAASLTKPFVATLALRLDASGVLRLETPIGELLPSARGALARRPVESLLRHRSGLAAWHPLEKLQLGVPKTGAAPSALAEALLEWFRLEAGLGSPPGTYSDLGYLLYGLLVERGLGLGLFALLRREVLAPLGLLGEVFERPPAARTVDCALDGAREVELAGRLGFRLPRPARLFRGEAQDGNARFVGRLCGHAGLFVTADALVALGAEWLRPGPLLDAHAVARALGGPRGRFALGWARRRRAGSAGLALSREAFGHTGFTGGSLWIDPARRLVVALAAHRRSTAIELDPLRRDLHRFAVATFVATERSSGVVRMR